MPQIAAAFDKEVAAKNKVAEIAEAEKKRKRLEAQQSHLLLAGGAAPPVEEQAAAEVRFVDCLCMHVYKCMGVVADGASRS